MRKENGRLEKVQVKYRTGDGRIVKVKIESTSAWVRHRYTAVEVDWMAVYDAASDRCYYVHSSVFDGQTTLNLRLTPPANGQRKLIRFADSYTSLDAPGNCGSPGPNESSPLPFEDLPE